jgi:hypothetical protein
VDAQRLFQIAHLHYLPLALASPAADQLHLAELVDFLLAAADWSDLGRRLG